MNNKNELVQKDVLSRLKKIEGQVRGVQKMVEQNRDCSEIVVQLSAIKAAVNTVGINVLGCHLAECINECMAEKQKVDQTIDQFLTMFKKFS